MQRRLVGARLFLLLGVIRESALPVYESAFGYKEIHRQLLILIGVSGGLSSHEIVALTGHEKAQVSRAIKPLEEAGLIGRERLRAKLTLLPAGRMMFDGIMAMMRARDGALTAGIAADALGRFATLTERLTVQAARIYAEERRLSMEAGVIGACAASQGLPNWSGSSRPPQATLVTPRLLSLVAYLKRGAMLAYQRAHSLSHFQWQVLSVIGECPPAPLARLILAMGRDKSQVGRTVDALEQAGLVIRSRPTRRRDVMLEPTERGAAIYESMCDLALRRESMLWSGFDAGERAFYTGVIDTLTANAQDMLEQVEAGISQETMRDQGKSARVPRPA